MSDVLDRVRAYWDADAATYDDTHAIGTATEWAAWNAALTRLLPPAPARILDVGAGTGFLSVLLAELGYAVTALDLSARMLERLQATAARHDLAIDVVAGPAHEPPPGPFDAVCQRHLLWLLPDPVAALSAWREATPAGRLVVFEGVWGQADPGQAWRQSARELARRLRRRPPGHHAPFDPALRHATPMGQGTPPDAVVEAVTAAGWTAARVERLRDVEWARLLAKPPVERWLGTIPQFAVAAR